MRRGIAVAAIVACFGCRAVVLAGLDEAQAGEVARALDAAQIAARIERESSGGRGSGRGLGRGQAAAAFRVEVPQADVGAALAALQAAGLPRREARGLEALDQHAGLIATPEEERGRLASALGGELSRTLARLPGVVEARVHVSPRVAPAATRAGLDQPPSTPKAGVLLLRAHGVAPLPESGVRDLVAAAVPDLDPEGVTVVQVEAPRVARPPAHAMVAVGPISVAHGSAAPLRALLAAALIVHLALAVALIAVVARKRRAD